MAAPISEKTKKGQKSLKNRWHIAYYKKNSLSANYIEWKYFNFTSKTHSGIFVYFLCDAKNLTGVGGGKIIGRLYARNKITGNVEKFKMAKIKSSAKTPEIKIGKNTIKIRGGAYKITGKAGKLEWNLLYTPKAAPISAFSNMEVDPLNLEKVSWFIQMPKAEVKGTIKDGKRKIKIKTMGYTDANWGVLIPLTTTFQWAQYNDNKISVVVGELENFEIRGKKFGRWAVIYIIHGNKKIVFKKGDFILKNKGWKFINKSKIRIPTITSIQGENQKYKISLTIKMEIADPIFFNMPFHFPIRPAVIEQVSIFKGELAKKENGKTRTIHKISGRGFKEYSTRGLFGDKDIKKGLLTG